MRSSRREFLRASAAAATSVAGAAERTKRPNVLFVFSDQQQALTVSAYGGSPVRTPQIDRIAAEGCRFDSAISIYAVCSPYRGMLMSGLYPMHNGVVGNDTPLSDGLQTLGTSFRDAGYRTGYIGKWHLETRRDGFVPHSRRQGFEDYWAVHSCNHDHFNSPYYADDPNQELIHRGYEPDSQTDLAVEFIQESAAARTPFCLVLSFGPPHDPYKAPAEYEDRFRPEVRIPLPPNAGEREVVDELLRTDTRPLNERQARARARNRARLDDDDRLRSEILRGYYGACEALDACVGRLLDKLDETGIADDTIVIYTSDHGDMAGAHRMISKQSPFDESVHVPFLLRYPAGVADGISTDVLLTPVDILPTLLSIAAVPFDPDQFDGRDLSGAMGPNGTEENGSVPLMKMVHGGNPWLHNGIRPWRGVRTPRFTYAEMEGAPWILFDDQEDPYQMVNLVRDTERTGLRRELSGEIGRWRSVTSDTMTEAQIGAFQREQRHRYDHGV